jgi:plasmid stabilization system protein ParE
MPSESFRVVVERPAEDALFSYYLRAAVRAPEAARRWLEGFERAILSLGENPLLHARAPESGLGGYE